MTDLEKLAVKLANTLLQTAIGHTYHQARPEERIDMSVEDFTKLREAAKEITSFSGK